VAGVLFLSLSQDFSAFRQTWKNEDGNSPEIATSLAAT
jgi:hypothetical protein